MTTPVSIKLTIALSLVMGGPGRLSKHSYKLYRGHWWAPFIRLSSQTYGNGHEGERITLICASASSFARRCASVPPVMVNFTVLYVSIKCRLKELEYVIFSFKLESQKGFINEHACWVWRCPKWYSLELLVSTFLILQDSITFQNTYDCLPAVVANSLPILFNQVIAPREVTLLSRLNGSHCSCSFTLKGCALSLLIGHFVE